MTQDNPRMGDLNELVARLETACNGHPHAKIEWPHRILHEAAAAITSLIAERDGLRGLLPELPPYPPEGGGLPRYGLRWNGPADPLATPMEDGYWTPYHLADQYRRYYYEAGEELSEVAAAIGMTRWMDPPDGGSVSLEEQVRRMCADLEAAEAQLKAAREVIEWASRQRRKPYGVTVAIDALSLDTNKGDGV